MSGFAMLGPTYANGIEPKGQDMAKLPSADRAIIPERKITAYLMSHAHPYGAPKAVFFERFGYRSTNWEYLRDALLVHAQDHEVDRSFPTRFGTMYEVVGPLASPDGRNPSVLVAGSSGPVKMSRGS